MNRCRELHCVQVPPGALRSQVGLRTMTLALRALKPQAAKTDMDI